MGVLESIGNVFKRVSRNSNAKPSNATPKSVSKEYDSYRSLFDRDDFIIPYDMGRSILRDTQVGTGYDILKYLLSSKKWILTNQEEDTEIYDFIQDMLQSMTKEVNTIVKQMVASIMWGYNIHEVIYDVKDGKIVIKDMVPIHIKTLQQKPFVYDNNGELKFIHQVVDGQDYDIPANKCLIYSFGSEYDEIQGDGLLHDFLPIVEDKDNLMDWLMTFCEKNESPTMYGKTNDPTARDELLRAFEEIADGTTGLTVGQDDEVGILESTHRGETYFAALQYKDNQIFRRMFIGNLLMGDNSQTGTYAQSQTQLEFGSMVFDGILEEIANTFQSKINDIVEYNFGQGRKAPVIAFDKFSMGDMKLLFDIINQLISNGTIDSENSAVQEAIALLFKAEAGVEYVNTEPVMPEENFEYQPNPEGTDGLTDNILEGIDAITG